jgi:hypothetical protein
MGPILNDTHESPLLSEDMYKFLMHGGDGDDSSSTESNDDTPEKEDEEDEEKEDNATSSSIGGTSELNYLSSTSHNESNIGSSPTHNLPITNNSSSSSRSSSQNNSESSAAKSSTPDPLGVTSTTLDSPEILKTRKSSKTHTNYGNKNDSHETLKTHKPSKEHKPSKVHKPSKEHKPSKAHINHGKKNDSDTALTSSISETNGSVPSLNTSDLNLITVSS